MPWIICSDGGAGGRARGAFPLTNRTAIRVDFLDTIQLKCACERGGGEGGTRRAGEIMEKGGYEEAEAHSDFMDDSHEQEWAKYPRCYLENDKGRDSDP